MHSSLLTNLVSSRELHSGLGYDKVAECACYQDMFAALSIHLLKHSHTSDQQ